jgi:hypothetical protein
VNLNGEQLQLLKVVTVVMKCVSVEISYRLGKVRTWKLTDGDSFEFIFTMMCFLSMNNEESISSLKHQCLFADILYIYVYVICRID